MLHEFLTRHRDEIVRRTRAKVLVRRDARPGDEDLPTGAPLFVDQLIETLISAGYDEAAISISATTHGARLLKMGFTVGQVVHDYGDVCQAVTELAGELDAPISMDEFRTLNRCLDDAIAGAVTEFTRLREDAQRGVSTERLGVLAHELRNSLNGALLAHGMIKNGSVGVGGSTSAVLERSLLRLGALIARSLAEVRIEAGVSSPEDIHVASFIEEVELQAQLEASAAGVSLTVVPVARALVVFADQPIVSAALTNLLQNAFKFTRSGGQVTLTTSEVNGRLRIDVADECGGLPAGKATELFRPFVQRSANRAGIGLGLFIVRRGIEADGGVVSVRDIPGTGCVFTIELPLSPRYVGPPAG